MKFPVFSYRDKLNNFGAPIVESNELTAMRGFKMQMNNPEGMMNFSPTDFDLYRIGEFDPEKGTITSEKVPVLVLTGVNAIGE